MSDRDEINRVPLGELEQGERYVGCLHFGEGVTFVEAARLWHEVARYASTRFGERLDIEDAELCREFDFGASTSIYRSSSPLRAVPEAGEVR